MAPGTTVAPIATLSGDANADGSVNLNDITSILDQLLKVKTCESQANADADASSSVDMVDLLRVIGWLVD